MLYWRGRLPPSPEGEGLKRRPVRAEWPAADVVVGNPPFLGNKKMISGSPATKINPAKEGLGEEYTLALRKAWPEVSGGVDLVCYWFVKAWEMMAAGKLRRAGLVATNSIRGGANREVLKPMVEHGRIFEAWSDEEWTVDGAAVRVSMVCFDMAHGERALLNGNSVAVIYAGLADNGNDVDLTAALTMSEMQNLCYQGTIKGGDFDIDGETAREWLGRPLNPNGKPNSEVVKQWTNGMDITRRPSDTWVIDFGTNMSEEDAALFEQPYLHILENVKPIRSLVRRQNHRENWWLHGEARPGMRRVLEPLLRYIGTPRVSKYRLFTWMSKATLPDSAIYAIARDDDTSFGILHSTFHELWSLRMGTFLGVGNDPRYTPSTTFETFPFPAGLTPNIPAADYAADPRAIAIAAAAVRLNELRENWLNPEDLIIRTPEVVPGYPDRILPRDDAAAVELKKRTLTNLYNARPAWLDNAHKALDVAVAEAYGWGDDWRSGAMTDDEILARLFRLNQERAAEVKGAG